MKHLLLTTIAALLLVGCGESPNELLHQAVIDGNIEAVKQHIAAGTDVNAKGSGGITPLLAAAMEGQNHIAELLISKGADVNARDDKGMVPLHFAAYMDRKKIVELLIANGADVNARVEAVQLKGKTPLNLAITGKHKETADLIRKHGGKTGEELKAENK